MPKTQDIPIHLRGFNQHFEGLSRRHDWSTAFADTLQWACAAWCMTTGIEEVDGFVHNHASEAVKRYDDAERRHMAGCVLEMAEATGKALGAEGWSDCWGAYYECIQSSNKASRLGQFFTPEALCTMSAQMVGNSRPFALAMEPACGSGRMVLAHHVINPSNRVYYSCADIDPMCCHMAALNLMMHGVEGEVICANTLAMEFRWGYRVNPWLHTMSLPCLAPIRHPAHSLMFGGTPLMFGQWREANPVQASPREAVAVPPPPATNQVIQLKLFDL